MAGAALREPGCCLWSTVAAGPRTFLRGRCGILGARDAAGAWQVQHLESLDAASSDTTHLTLLQLPLLCRCSCLSPFMFALLAFVPFLWLWIDAWLPLLNRLRGTAHLFAWQVQHLVHRMLPLRGRCST